MAARKREGRAQKESAPFGTGSGQPDRDARVGGRVQGVVTFFLPNPGSARAMQDGVRLALFHFLKQLTDFQCGRRNACSAFPRPRSRQI